MPNKNIIDKLKDVPYCDEQESKQIAKILDNLTEEDMEIVEEHKLIEIRPVVPIVLNLEETKQLILGMKSAKMPPALIKFLTNCIGNGVSDINILCRLTEDSFQETVNNLNEGE